MTKLEQAARQALPNFKKLYDKVMAAGNLGHQWTGLQLADDCSHSIGALLEALDDPKQAALSVPEGYALVSIDALKAWGKHDEVRNACQFPAEQAEQDLDTCPGCGGVADNGHDREFPPNPYYCTKCTEQAAQEPIGYALFRDGVHTGTERSLACAKRWVDAEIVPLYAAPVRTKDLTDDEIDEIPFNRVSDDPLLEYARAVIAAYKEKNK